MPIVIIFAHRFSNKKKEKLLQKIFDVINDPI